jgi:hypothetical protein
VRTGGRRRFVAAAIVLVERQVATAQRLSRRRAPLEFVAKQIEFRVGPARALQIDRIVPDATFVTIAVVALECRVPTGAPRRVESATGSIAIAAVALSKFPGQIDDLKRRRAVAHYPRVDAKKTRRHRTNGASRLKRFWQSRLLAASRRLGALI